MTTFQLPSASPESQGIAASSILAFVDSISQQLDELHSFILVRHGHVVAEAYWSPYARELPHSLYSLSKSFTSSAVGLAIAEGYFSLDDLLISHFPEDLPSSISENLAKLKVRHLLMMATGHEGDTMPFMVERADGNWAKGFLGTPIIDEPGTRFFYNTGATYMLSALIYKTTGMNLTEYLEPRLFRPLGIENPVWEKCPRGIDTGGFGLSIRTRDIANFGQLYLQKGQWGSTRLLSEAWVEMATSAQISNVNFGKNDWGQGYGFQFWRCQHNAYRGDGAFGQYCIVMPEQDAVLAMTGGLADMQIPLNIVWDCLLPAMQAEALPENPQAQAALNQRLSSLKYDPVAGQASSPIAAKVSGIAYEFPENPLQLQRMSLDFAAAGCTVHIKTASRDERFECGFGAWQAGRSHLFKEHPFADEQVMLVSGAWQDESTFKIQIRLYETPFIITHLCRFTDAGLELEARVNVSFMPEKSLSLVGKAR